MEPLEIFQPRSLEINNFIYSFKDSLKNDYYTYRCKYRSKCGFVLKISRTELIKYKEGKDISEIQFEFTSKIKNHTCLNDNEAIKSDDKKKILLKVNNKDIIKSLIITNIDKNISFHVENLKNNNIILKKNHVKYLLQKYRENKFSSDDKYLKNISDIVITYDTNVADMINIPMCFCYKNFLNIEHKNKLEKFVVITTIFQLNLFNKCTQIFIDGTFKSCPKGYYQVLNIAGFYPDINSIIPIFMVPCTRKTEYLYNEIFSEIKRIYLLTGHKKEEIPNHIMIERSIQKSIKTNFKDAIVNGCYFHYSKLLWNTAKKYGLCTKDKIKNTKILLFILKIFPFIFIGEREELFEKLENYYIDEQDNYKKMIKYFKKIG